MSRAFRIDTIINIAVADDDPRICRQLQRMLTGVGYSVKVGHTRKQIVDLFTQNSFDLVIVDLHFPDYNGFDILRDFNLSLKSMVILLTGTKDEYAEVIALESGADDYIEKPVKERELLARVRSVLRRARFNTQIDAETTTEKAEESYTFKPWCFEVLQQRLVHDNGMIVHLTSSEAALLQKLAQRKNIIFTREQLMHAVSNQNWDPSSRTIDVLISKLRKKLSSENSENAYIKSIRNTGFRFIGNSD